MVRPLNVLYLLVAVTILIALLGWVTPNGLKFGLISINTVQISSLFKNTLKSEKLSKPASIQVQNLDSSRSSTIDTTLTKFVGITDSILDIQYPNNEDTIMNVFFNALHSIDTLDHPVHILHFGDSQIEGDRITSSLRANFHQNFGGCGTGLLPIVDPTHTRFSHKISSTKSWDKITPADKKAKAKLPYGIYCSYFERKEKSEDVEILIKKTSNASSNVAQAETFTIIKYPIEDTVVGGLEVFQKESLLKDNKNEEVVSMYHLEKPLSHDIKVNIKGNTNPILQAFSFDCNYGVSVDNISLRGSSMVDFTKMHSAFFRAVCKSLHVKLVILQFGVNVVPYEVEDYSHYEKLCYQQLLSLKRLVGNDVSVLMIGVSDMSKSSNGDFITYPKLKLIRDAQKRAALNAHCAFWDLYNNMGGKNSMVSWVKADKPLAGSDYTHFTPAGASLVGNMIYKAIIKDYENSKK